MTDFLLWSHDVLARFAKECSEENSILREDLKILLQEYRNLVTENARLKGVQDPPLGLSP